MAQDVVEQITENIKIDKIFAIEIDESMDVSNEAKLLVYIQYFDVKKGVIADEILGCKQLPDHTKGEDISKILDSFIRLELDLQWESCVSVSTDGAASMSGQKSGHV
ncbi:Zinc finger MYM-type protein 6 [Zootermopsis nevadensis]|uniref:Zinc finger MYM-type protein 6 n=1 Tax=Zootermopsis nevadensis TaxID=136037 RepID=A0A067QU62_ZOONE|nr:Zinc finger MYM-type protein 6 [Zootermopsis nevadensis]